VSQAVQPLAALARRAELAAQVRHSDTLRCPLQAPPLAQRCRGLAPASACRHFIGIEALR
jgi:hypothetical protein